MKLHSYTGTNIGKVRKNNEDNFFSNGAYKQNVDRQNDSVTDVRRAGAGLYAVFDGMGGEELGEEASLIAAQTLCKYADGDFRQTASDYIKDANRQICALMDKDGGRRSGTTFSALYIEDETAFACNVGDSRVYLFRKGELKQLSQDHTKIQQLLRMGAITQEEARTRRDRHVLTQHLGIFEDELLLSAHRADEIALQNGDIFLLCSDGLTDMLDDAEIRRVIDRGKTPREIGEALMTGALEKGGRDNVTVQVVQCTSSDVKKKLILALAVIALVAAAAAVIWLGAARRNAGNGGAPREGSGSVSSAQSGSSAEEAGERQTGNVKTQEDR